MNTVTSQARRLRLPDAAKNNVWYDASNSETVIIFVHGLLSDSRGCWLFSDKKQNNVVYWPQLVLEDQRLRHPAVYLGGYYTQLDANAFGVSDCAVQLFRGALARGY